MVKDHIQSNPCAFQSLEDDVSKRYFEDEYLSDSPPGISKEPIELRPKIPP
jgi:hypothetical protein